MVLEKNVLTLLKEQKQILKETGTIVEGKKGT